MKQSCETCRYFERDRYVEGIGIFGNNCHRFPGIIRTGKDNFCGEYKKKSQRSEDNK
jgi:hypothetical protein